MFASCPIKPLDGKIACAARTPATLGPTHKQRAIRSRLDSDYARLEALLVWAASTLMEAIDDLKLDSHDGTMCLVEELRCRHCEVTPICFEIERGCRDLASVKDQANLLPSTERLSSV